LLPGFGKESFVQFGVNDGERLFIPLDHPRTTDAELLSQRLRAGKEAHGSVRLPGEGERRSEAADAVGDLDGFAEIADDAIGVVADRDGVVEPTFEASRPSHTRPGS
jgi:hypothetical protein